MPTLIINPPTAAGNPTPEVELVSLTRTSGPLDRGLITSAIMSAVGNHVIGGRVPDTYGDFSATWRATNSAGTTEITRTVSIADTRGAQSRITVHVDSDIDTVGERDDISAMALWLGNQDDFNLVGFTCSPPDGNHQEYINCINAYEQDRPNIIAKPGINSADFKPGADLLALVVDGANADAPTRGYRLSGETQYAVAHAAAQLLIANARDYGDPDSSDPTRKLWVGVQGGYVTLAQAAYEACDPAGPMELPDFWDRIRVVGQPNWNSRQAPNSWNYLVSNIWPAAGTPGIFGNAWMLCGYLQWHGLNRDNGTTDATFWNEITANSAFGTHLRNTLTRPSGTFTTPHFRAGDAGIWYWLKSAKDQGNFDPANTANLCGHYRTYAGELWAAQTFGYGAGSGIQTSNPNPEHTTWSTTMWAPELTVNSFAAGEAAVDLDAWYPLVRSYLERFMADAAVPAQVGQPSVSTTGISRTVSWTAPANNGSTISDYVIRVNGAVVADGVGTGTTYSTGDLADGNYSVTVAAVNAIGEGPQSTAATFTIDASATPEPGVGSTEPIIINFRLTTSPSVGYNEVFANSTANDTLPNLRDNTGAETGYSFAISHDPSTLNIGSNTNPGRNGNTLGDDSYPSGYTGEILCDELINSAMGMTSSVVTTYVLGNLTPGSNYNIQWVGSRAFTNDDRPNSLTLNGTEVIWETRAVPATLQDVTVAADANGQVIMVHRLAGVATWTHMNAMRIQAVA